MSKGVISRGDLLQALVQEDGELSHGLVESMGYCRGTAILKKNKLPPPDKEKEISNAVENDPEDNPAAAIKSDNNKPSALISFWQPISYRRDEINAPAEPPTTYPQHKHQAHNSALETKPEYRFLSPFNKLIPRLRLALSEQRPARAYDIPKIIDNLGRAKNLSKLPRKHRIGWGASLFVIEDRSAYLAPYILDQAMARDKLSHLYAKQGFQPCIFNDRFNWPQLIHKNQSLTDLKAQAGDHVLVLGDLGCLAQDDGKAMAFWRGFGQQMQNAGVKLLALLPCNTAECPTEISQYFYVLSWEHPAPAVLSDKEIEERGQTLLSHLSMSSRIEPGLLRDIRLSLGAEWLPARMEAWIWQHPVMDEPDSVATSLKSEQAADYQLNFNRDSQYRAKTIRLVKKWLADLASEFWLYSVLNLGDWADKHDSASGEKAIVSKTERQNAIVLLNYLATGAGGKEKIHFSHNAWGWIKGLVDSLDKSVADNKELKYAYWTLQKCLKQRLTCPPQSNHLPNNPITQFSLYHPSEQFIFSPKENQPNNASPIAAIESHDGYIQIEPLFWQSGQPPSWAVDWGQDNYGLWVEFEIQKQPQRMRWIPAGEFLMGSPEGEPGRWEYEGPQHEVQIKEGYWLFDTPVTQALWQVVMGENPSYFQTPQRPVEQVNWNDCQKFIEILNSSIPDLNLSLPSEVQWEYACRAGSETALYSGDINILGESNAPELDVIAWYGGNSGVDFDLKNGHDSSDWPEKQYPHKQAGSHPVLQKKSNPWGLYDMLGNVWEWTADHWHEDYNKAPTEDSAWLDKDAKADAGRVLRGGSWSDGARICRSAARGRYQPDERNYDFGFRCARVQARAQPAYSGVVTQAEPVARRDGRGEAVQLVQNQAELVINNVLKTAQILSLRSDREQFLLQKLTKPDWASAMGRDCYGLWMEFSLDSEDGEVTQRMRWIPPGQFLMGSPEDEAGRFVREGPQHPVTLSQGYWLFDTPVTQALWQVIMGANPSRFKDSNRPVEWVSWDDCQKFIDLINEIIPELQLTLPSEAQWEYACRAGTVTSFNFGNNVNPEQVNYNGNYPFAGGEKGEFREKTVPVKHFSPNPYGLYQMHGNVWEWTEDHWHDNYIEAPADGGAWVNKDAKAVALRVLRGGSWVSGARDCRSAARGRIRPEERDSSIGFRCARVQAK